MWDLIQISGHGIPEAILLQSKVARHGSPGHHISDVETPRRAARRHPAVFGSRDGASVVFRVHRTACGVRMEPRFAEVAAPKVLRKKCRGSNTNDRRRAGTTLITSAR